LQDGRLFVLILALEYGEAKMVGQDFIELSDEAMEQVTAATLHSKVSVSWNAVTVNSGGSVTYNISQNGTLFSGSLSGSGSFTVST
jgi:hypothetical protein